MDRLSQASMRDSNGRKKKESIVEKRNISGDEFMAASIGDVVWLDQTMKENDGKASGFDRNGLAPIHLAALHGRLKCLQLLLETYDEDVNLKSTTGWTALHLCLNKEIGPRAIKCMNYLLASGASVNEYNDDDVSPIHQAASEGLFECLKVLVANADWELLSLKDCRGYTALDLAKIWGHKNCARLLKTEIWKREKERTAIELEQLKTVKKFFTGLQQDAVYQLRNEQDFYGGVAFGNWLSEKGLPEDLRHVTISQLERYPDASIDGLIRRLQTSGGMEDCHQRLEKGTIKQRNRLASRIRDSVPTNVATTSKSTNQKSKPLKPVKPVKQAPKKQEKEKVVKKVKVRGLTPDVPEFNDTPVTFTPFSERLPSPRTTAYHRNQWNFSTNIKSKPATEISRKDIVSMSIHPDESLSVLPPQANLSVRLATTPETKIRFTVPGGHVESAGIRMPNLPKKLVTDTLYGENADRIRIPQEFKAVHVYDLQKKRVGEKPEEEASMHLRMFGDKKFVRRSTIVGSSMPTSIISYSSMSDIFPPLTKKAGYTRILDTLKGMNSPRAFLA